MDQPTRRFDQPAPGEETPRLASASDADSLLCPYCGGEMLATTAYWPGGEPLIKIRDARDGFFTIQPRTTLHTSTCRGCGHTAFFADLQQLTFMIESYEQDARSN